MFTYSVEGVGEGEGKLPLQPTSDKGEYRSWRRRRLGARKDQTCVLDELASVCHPGGTEGGMEVKEGDGGKWGELGWGEREVGAV